MEEGEVVGEEEEVVQADAVNEEESKRRACDVTKNDERRVLNDKRRQRTFSLKGSLWRGSKT